jgi:D-inositol-3-phosphate glycosyltransferase
MLSYHTCPLATLGGKDTGGMNVYVRDLTRQLGPLGVKVDVFTRSQDEHVPHVLHDLGYGNRVVHVPAGPEIPLPKQELAGYIRQFVAGIFDFADVKGLSYDIVHSHYWMSGIAAKELKKAWDVPVVHTFHTLGAMKQRVARTNEEAEGEYRLTGERQVLEIADRIIASTQAEVAQLQWLYQAHNVPTVVIPPGVDLSRFYPIPLDEAKEFVGVPPCDRVLLFVGRIEPLKGIDTLIEAIALILQQDIFEEGSMCLAIIGGDPDASEEKMTVEMMRLKDLCDHFGLGDMVTFLGKRDQDTLPYYYSAAEAVVMPSQYESFGMVALEAMACGTLVVASEVGGLAFLVRDGETGYTVPASDPEALAAKLKDIIIDKDLRHRMGEQAAEFAQGYDWHIIAEQIMQLYEDLI